MKKNPCGDMKSATKEKENEFATPINNKSEWTNRPRSAITDSEVKSRK